MNTNKKAPLVFMCIVLIVSGLFFPVHKAEANIFSDIVDVFTGGAYSAFTGGGFTGGIIGGFISGFPILFDPLTWAVIDRFSCSINVLFGCDSYGNSLPENYCSSHYLTDTEAQCYLDNYPDLQNAFGSTNIDAAKRHWLQYGGCEGRDYSCQPPACYPLDLTDSQALCYLYNYPNALLSVFGPDGIDAAKTHWQEFGCASGWDYSCHSCTNDANNPPVCDTYDSCTNGAYNPPDCNAFSSCDNGAYNPPDCTACPNGQTMVSGSCVNNCTNGATNPPTCTTPCTNGATNPPTCTPPTSANNASCGGINAPGIVAPGQTFGASVIMTNTGTKVWNSDSTPHNLGSQDPQDNGTWGVGRVGLPWEPVNPGQSVTFNFNVVAPSSAGTYSFDWEMVEDYIAWFGCKATASINVINCTNGATNPPTCDICPSGKTLVSGSCINNCTNGATNPPTCTTCPSGQTMVSGSCVNSCQNGATNPPTCDAFTPTTATLSASPASVAYNGQSTLTWGSSHATSCTAPSGNWSNSGTLSGSGLTNPLTANTTFTFQCTGLGGTTPLQSVTVNVGAPPTPTASLSVSPSTINVGQSATLTWGSTGATSCTAAGGFSTGGATSGSASTGALAQTSTYQVTCSGPGGTSIPASATVTVRQPTVSISANPTRVPAGTNSVIAWSASAVISCAISGPGLSSAALSGSQEVTINSQSTYTITCQTNSAPISQSVTVNVAALFQEF